MATTKETAKDRIAFENALQSLEAQIANVGAHLAVDSHARMAYARGIRKLADQLRNNATAGKMTWAQAAQEAQETRNLIMNIARSQSTPVGRSMAQQLKAQGYSLNERVATQTRRIHGESAVFSTLTTPQKTRFMPTL